MNASHKSACGRVIRLNTLFCRLITHRRFPAAQPEQVLLLSCETSGVSHWQRIVAGQKQACSMPAPLSKLSPLVPSTCCHMWYSDQQTLIRAKFSQPQGCQRDQRMVASWGKNSSDVKKIPENHAQTDSTLPKEGKTLFQTCSTCHMQGYILSC